MGGEIGYLELAVGLVLTTGGIASTFFLYMAALRKEFMAKDEQVIKSIAEIATALAVLQERNANTMIDVMETKENIATINSNLAEIKSDLHVLIGKLKGSGHINGNGK